MGVSQMNEGKRFEQNFKKSIPADVYCLRLTDSSPAGFGENENMRFSIQSPFDFILYKNGKMFALELKSIKGKSISFSGSSPMIKPHQVKALTQAAKFGIIAGFIFNFRENGTYFLTIQKFNDFVSSTTRKSIDLSHCKFEGIEMYETKLKVNSRYDTERLFEVI